MARQDQKTSDRRREDTRPDPDSGDWHSGERENEFGGEGRFRAEGTAHGSHFGGEPEALRDGRHSRNTRAWLGERRQKLMEKFERWRSERAARTANRGPDSASDGSSGRSAKK
jgi:hypothetical protein